MGEESTELLLGRLKLTAPRGSKSPAPLPDAPSMEEESRLVVEGPKLSLAIVARETFQLDPDLYEAESGTLRRPGTLDEEAPKFLRAMFGASSMTDSPLEISPVEIGPPGARLRAYVARPQHPNAPPGKDTALTMALLIAREDGMLESVAFYVRGEAVRSATGAELDGCTRLAERIGATITPGPRDLARGAGERHVVVLSDDSALAVTVPTDYVVIPSHSAPTSARLVKLRPLSLYAGSINITVKPLSESATSIEGADTTAAGKVLGKDVEWRGKTTEKGGFLFVSQPVDGRRAEVFVKATQKGKALDEMRGVAETLAIVKRAHP